MCAVFLVSLQMVVFIFMFCGSVFLMFHVTVGLDQELAMPQVSLTGLVRYPGEMWHFDISSPFSFLQHFLSHPCKEMIFNKMT